MEEPDLKLVSSATTADRQEYPSEPVRLIGHPKYEYNTIQKEHGNELREKDVEQIVNISLLKMYEKKWLHFFRLIKS